jgi:transposase
MLPEPSAPAWSETDLEVFGQLVPPDHYVRRALDSIDFQRFYPILARCYSAEQGRPAVDPVRMLKLGFLQYHDNLSDRQVIARAQTDVAYRYYLGLSLGDELPDHSLLSIFRGRLGVEGHRDIFQEIIAQAREHGLVKDRLRLKDATHVIADVAIPTTLALVAQTRDKLLSAAEPFDPLRVVGERARIDVIRSSSDGLKPEERLAARVVHLREILLWLDELEAPSGGEQNAAWQSLLAARRLAHKVLADQEPPRKGDRTRSIVDPDARQGKHGQWYDGYLLDVLMDADSELITAINVLPANADEGADAIALAHQEETYQGNDIEALSMDGLAFQGPLLRELQDPEGLALDVYVPPKNQPASEHFTSQDFSEDATRCTVTCPVGQTTARRERNCRNTGWKYIFPRQVCADCPLLERCLKKLPKKTGRMVVTNEYKGEYQQMRAKSQTEPFQKVRAEHPMIERKLSELVRRHGARRTRYRGRWKVLCGQLLAGAAANIKRMTRLLPAPTIAATQG